MHLQVFGFIRVFLLVLLKKKKFSNHKNELSHAIKVLRIPNIKPVGLEIEKKK